MPDRHLWRRHSTRTITFTGGPDAGDFDGTPTVRVFTCTGRSIIHSITAFCTVDLVSAGGGTMELGVAADADAFIVSTTATAIDANEWWGDGTPAAGSIVIRQPGSTVDGIETAQAEKTVSTDIIITIGTADITAGAIVFDVIYSPLTDGARLS